MATDESEYLFQDEEENENFLLEETPLTEAALELKPEVEPEQGAWKVLIVDDSISIHQITILVFDDFKFENKPIQFLSAYSGKEAQEIVQKHDDIALILLDVVMEEEDSGLKFVKFLRDIVKNKMTRIVMRTGQPGQAPEKEIIVKYDINDYKEKTELTQAKFYTTMVTALRSYRDLLELEKSRVHLRLLVESTDRFVPHAFLRHLNKESILHVKLGDRIEQDMTVLFMDMRSYTLLSEKLSVVENFNFINELFSYLEPTITEHGGFIDKYMGDAVMALFADSMDEVMLCSIDILKSLDKYNEYRASMGSDPVTLGISINAGAVAMGTIGFHDRMDCTVISDVVNTGAKLEKMNKVLGTHLLITGSAYEKLENKNAFDLRYLGELKIFGKNIHLPTYEVLLPLEIDSNKLKTRTIFNKAIKLFDEGKLEEAQTYFAEVQEMDPQDQVTQYFLNSIELELKLIEKNKESSEMLISKGT